MKKFILTDDEALYYELISIGFEGLGCRRGVKGDIYTLRNNGSFFVPADYSKRVLFTDFTDMGE